MSHRRARLRNGVLASAFLLASAPVAYAACPLDGATPLNIGPINPQNGFPEYVQDAQGLALSICLDEPMCFFDPVDPDNPFSVQIGFGAEGFWWAAEAGIATPSGFDARLIMAAEAAFNLEVPVDGDQFPFTRLRIRMDGVEPGIYTVTHPFGQESFLLGEGERPRIRTSYDIEFAADSVHQGRVGPFLTWDNTEPAPPPGYIGDASIAHTIAGSPCGTNFFRIEATALDGVTPIDLDGAGSNVVQTDQFIVMGKLFDGLTGTPLSVSRSTYARVNPGQVDVFARSTNTATVTLEGGPNLPAGPIPMQGDGNGLFWVTVPLENSGILPAVVEVTASNPPDNADTTLLSLLTDVVTITRADYDTATGVLTVEAHSSDEASPPTLTAGVHGELQAGVLVASNVAVPPGFITVTSSAGGFDTEPVRIIGSAPLNQPPTITSVPVTTATVGQPYSYQVTATDPDAGDTLTFSLTTAPAGMAINAATGLISWTPTVGQEGNQPVTVQVSDAEGLTDSQSFIITVQPAAAVNQPPTITSIPVTTATVDQPYSYQVTATDPDAGDTLTFSLTTAPAGMAINAATGLISWTPTVGQEGDQAVTVQVSDAEGLTDSQSFIVTVQPAAAVNQPPTITSIPVTTATVDQPYSYQVTATDPDVGDTLTFSLTTAPAGLAINAATGLITWTPTAGQEGDQPVTVQVSDAEGLTDSQSFIITVQPAGDVDVLGFRSATYTFTLGRHVWSVSGDTSSRDTSATITVFVGPTLDGPVLGTAPVSSTGQWSLNLLNAAIGPDATATVSFRSSNGGMLLAQPVQIR